MERCVNVNIQHQVLQSSKRSTNVNQSNKSMINQANRNPKGYPDIKNMINQVTRNSKGYQNIKITVSQPNKILENNICYMIKGIHFNF